MIESLAPSLLLLCAMAGLRFGPDFCARRGPPRLLGALAAGIAVSTLLLAALLAQERLYPVHGRTYPHWLARNLGTLDAAALDRLRRTDCLGHRLEMFEKDDGAGWSDAASRGWRVGHC
ncbi:hypothetical protein [Cupriavidus malaysiensis]|uniref:Uncharacterized protein n=1 Tax=Cupriavidus malaysiensis TaxID=367825 RepID=A0ABN4TXF7_9BURK|nr:hypothetical protein [Cupriavidus malaysiensis]AOZ09998.1 hypothetical protein BKK80_30495 [Cupriavidus malaysiensis]